MSLERKIDELVKNIVLLQGKTDQRQKAFDHAAYQAQQAISEAGKALGSTAVDIKNVTKHTVEQAIHKPVDDLEERIQIIKQELSYAANYVSNQQMEVVKKLKFVSWGTLAASGIAVLVSLGAAFMIIQSTKQELIRTEWAADINNAVEKGTLTRCANGNGICAKAKGRLIRLSN